MSEAKGEQVRVMFDELAPNYDLMNRIMTVGQDQRWRRYVIKQAQIPAGGKVLDLAAGTGDIAFEAKKAVPDADVTAGDFSLGMMQVGKRRPGGDQISWVACDAMALPFPDNHFDAVVFGYLLRNVEKIDVALSEILRVLKPGGRAVCLDTMPPQGITGPFVRLYMKLALPLMGRIFAGNPDAYTYLSDSTINFETPENLADAFSSAGFEQVNWKTFMFKTVAVHRAERAPA